MKTKILPLKTNKVIYYNNSIIIMSEYAILIRKAQTKLKAADHMLNMSYKLVPDSKILLSVALNLQEALENAMSAALEVERVFKRVPPYSDNFESKYSVFKNKLVKKNPKFKEGHDLLRELTDIKNAHKQSPVEFSREGKFVICNERYDLKTVDVSALKKYISKAKVYIEQSIILINASVGILRWCKRRA